MLHASESIFALAALLGCSSPAWPLDPHKSVTQYARTAWTHADGLPEDTVKAIAQTKDGYLWIGTDEGLARFDGYDFVTFKKADGVLPSNSIEALATGNDGALWIGTADGLACYRAGKFRTYTIRDGLPDNFVVSVFEDHTGTVWVASGSSLSRLDHDRFVNYSADRILPVRRVRRIYEDHHNTILVAGRGGVVKRSGENFVPVLSLNDLTTDQFASLEDRAGNVWLGGTDLMMRTAEGKIKTLGPPNGFTYGPIRALINDRDNNTWIGTDDGLARFENGRFVYYRLDERHTPDRIRCMFEDREGNLWLGMSNGLYRLHDTLFTNYGMPEGWPSDEPITVHEDHKGQLWVGYQGAGIVSFRGASVRAYSTRDGLLSNEIFSIRETRRGDLLVMTRAGVSVMRDGLFSSYPRQAGVIPVDILEDRDGQVWVAASGGIYQIKGTGFRRMVPPIPGVAFWSDSAVVLSEGLDGSIWAGTFGAGLWRIKDGKARRYTTADGLTSDRIRSLSQDQDGTLWIGTFGGGLDAYRDGVFAHYTARDGLLSDNISHIEDDRAGALWLATTGGVCRIVKAQLRDFTRGAIRSLSPVNYGSHDGLRSTQCAPGVPIGGGGTRTHDGRLWFPTARGLSVIDPNTPLAKEIPPVLHIVAISVDGHAVEAERAARFRAGSNHLQFRYSAIHLVAPEEVRYEYLLEGLDRDWVSARSRRVIDYSTLHHGSYRFRARASIPGLPPSEASFGFEIMPHFYEMSSFLWLCVGSLIGALFGLYRMRLRQIRGRFSLVLDERTRMAREIHDTLAQGFFGISSQLDALSLQMDRQSEAARQHLQLAQKMARHSLVESRRSVMNLRDSTFDDLDLASSLEKAAPQWAGGDPNLIEVQVSLPLRKLPRDIEENTFRIAQEAVANSLKHANATKVTISLQAANGRLVLVVNDNGRGFESNGAFSALNGHYGLLGMRERAGHMGGQMELSSLPSRGTSVTLSVPLAREYEHSRKWKHLAGIAAFWRRVVNS